MPTSSQFSVADARSKDWRRCHCLIGFILLLISPQAWPAETEILVGRSAVGQLKVDLGFTQPLTLEASVFPGITGYATGLLGVHSTDLDNPANDFFRLLTTSDLRFILLAKDPGMQVWNDTGSAYMGIGEMFFIGQAPFDTHPVWNVVTGTPGISYSLTLKLRDLNGVYTDSAAFLLSFTPEQVLHRINVKYFNSQLITLSWTTNAASWEVQSAVTLAATNWVTVTNVPGIVGTNFSLSMETSGPQQFFRLRK